MDSSTALSDLDGVFIIIRKIVFVFYATPEYSL